ncbi:hypothetical protein K525DRAFT_275376 [Schizophyllum commune Loenen D]|nr:hypothetical protein K525DRAFT_275376 [Schizophyllum commune Loenen D]
MDPTSRYSVLSTVLRILADPPTTPAGETEALAQCIEAFYQEHQVIVRNLRPFLDGTIAARVEADARVQDLTNELATAKARAEFDANVSNIRMETLRKEMKQTKLLAEVRLLDCLRQLHILSASSCTFCLRRAAHFVCVELHILVCFHLLFDILILANSSNFVDVLTSFRLLMLAGSILLFTYPLPSALLAIIYSLAHL